MLNLTTSDISRFWSKVEVRCDEQCSHPAKIIAEGMARQL